MNNDYTAAALIVDRSGSMSLIHSDAEGGINSFITEQAKLPGKCTLRIDQFDTHFEKVIPSTPIADVKPFSLVPRGATALLDAIGKSVVEFGEELAAMPENERPGKVVVIVVTDGLENASHEWKRERVFNLIKQQENVYNWKFVFLAANQDAIATGTSYGFSSSSALTYAPTSKGTRSVYASASRSLGAYRGGTAQSVTFDDSDREAAVEE